MNSEKVVCFNCQKPLEIELGQKVFKSDTCLNCHADIRCCRMCIHYDTSSYNDCREPNAARIVEKEKANFCDYFKVSDGGIVDNSKDKLLDAAESLFKK